MVLSVGSNEVLNQGVPIFFKRSQYAHGVTALLLDTLCYSIVHIT